MFGCGRLFFLFQVLYFIFRFFSYFGRYRCLSLFCWSHLWPGRLPFSLFFCSCRYFPFFFKVFKFLSFFFASFGVVIEIHTPLVPFGARRPVITARATRFRFFFVLFCFFLVLNPKKNYFVSFHFLELRSFFFSFFFFGGARGRRRKRKSRRLRFFFIWKFVSRKK